MKAVLLACVCNFFITTGQVLWKIAIDKNGGLIKEGIPLMKNLLIFAKSPYMLSGIAMYAAATVLWMYLLGKYEYSYIYPMLSLAYVFAFLYAIFWFKEQVNIYRWIGVGLIIAGVFFINKS